MNQFYSSLIINSKKFPQVHQVFRPRYNKEFFKRLTANIDALEQQIDKRCKDKALKITNESLKLVRENSRQLLRLKETLENLDAEQNEEKYLEALSKLQSIEDLIMPTVVRIPNRSSKFVPDEEKILDELKTDFQQRQNLTKVLSHRKLSYINNCYTKSVVGPNSHYYFGIGAKLLYSLSDYFTSELEKEKFIPLSGLCLVKSAVVEAANSKDTKDYMHDPCRILTDEPKPTTLHLTEASRESLLGYISTLGHIDTNDPVRMYMAGSCYHQGSDWFDGNDKSVSQSETIHAMIWNSSIEAYSMKEYQNVTKVVWNIYKKLQLPTRLVHCSLDSMLSNEFDSHRIDIWLPSRQDWLQVSRISHYRDFLSTRVGMRRGHLIDSQLYDSQVLAAAIIENRQTAMGKFLLPNALADHSIDLTNEERKNYLEANNDCGVETSKAMGENPFIYGNRMAKVLNNHEQRRYVAHRRYIYGHAKKTWDQASGVVLTSKRVMGSMGLILFASICDWTEIWMSMIPDWLRRPLYDYIYRPVRNVWWSIVYINVPERKPDDLSYDELDKRAYELTRNERNRKRILQNRYGPDDMEIIKANVERIRAKVKGVDENEKGEGEGKDNGGFG